MPRRDPQRSEQKIAGKQREAVSSSGMSYLLLPFHRSPIVIDGTIAINLLVSHDLNFRFVLVAFDGDDSDLLLLVLFRLHKQREADLFLHIAKFGNGDIVDLFITVQVEIVDAVPLVQAAFQLLSRPDLLHQRRQRRQIQAIRSGNFRLHGLNGSGGLLRHPIEDRKPGV